MRHKAGKLLLAAALAGGWTLWRRRKYPTAKGYPSLELFPVPGWVLTPSLARLGNRILRQLPLPRPPAGVRREFLCCAGADGHPVPLTLYRPEHVSGPLPCLVYFHGGRFCFEAAGYLHRNVADYARLAGCLVVMVHYRTSDRFPFPVPFQDCRAALGYVHAHAGQLDADAGRLAVGGDSAGGALAAACALWAREAGIPVCFQLLLYPVTDARMTSTSMAQYRDSPLWSARLNRRMWQLYLRGGCQGPRQFASPLEAEDLSGLPGAYVEVEQLDCLRDEGAAYAGALERAGSPVELRQLAGTFHGFDLFRSHPLTGAAIRTRARALQRAFAARSNVQTP